MCQKTGILHVYSNPSTEKEIHIVGDEEGLYRLWLAVEKATISRDGRGNATVALSDGRPLDIHIQRMDRKSQFLKIFLPS